MTQVHELTLQRLREQVLTDQNRLIVCLVCAGMIMIQMPRYTCDECRGIVCGGCYCEEHGICMGCHG